MSTPSRPINLWWSPRSRGWALLLWSLGTAGVPSYAFGQIDPTAPALVNHLSTGDSAFDSAPHLASDGTGQWVAVWTSAADFNGAGTDDDIFIARSMDGGATWSAPTLLYARGTMDTAFDHDPQVATDGAGNWMVVWESNATLDGTVGTDTDLFVARSTDAGATWTSPELLNTNGTEDEEGDSDPQLAADGAGNWVTVWCSDENLHGTAGADDDLFVARSADGGATWSSPTLLNTNGTEDASRDREPTLATDGAGNWAAAWWTDEDLNGTAGDDEDVFVTRSSDGGATWSSPALLNTNGTTDNERDGGPDIAADGAGNWVAVWWSGEPITAAVGRDFDILVARSTDGGATWTSPALLNTTGTTDAFRERDLQPEVATDGAGNWVTAWQSDAEVLSGTADNESDLVAARSTDAGASWSSPVLVNQRGADDDDTDREAELAADGAGNWIAVWVTSDNLDATIGGDDDILTARSTDGGATWDGPALLNASGFGPLGNDELPRVVSDGTGTWLTVWESTEDVDGALGRDEDILFARSMDGGNTWSLPSLLNINGMADSGNDHFPQIATDGLGNWVAAWSTAERTGGILPDPDIDLFVARSSDGGATWSAPALLNVNGTTDSGDDFITELTADGAGTWLAVWESSEDLDGTAGGDYDLFFARSTDAGATWSSPALLNLNGTDDERPDTLARVAADGGGNWVAVWSTFENLNGATGSDHDILVTRSTDGGVTWSYPKLLNTNGTADTGNDGRAVVATDRSGNWVAAWRSKEDLGGNTGIDPDIFVARSTDAGATWSDPELLNANGRTDSGIDSSPQITTDGKGNWVAVWVSRENLNGTAGTDSDLFAAHSTDAGATWSMPALLNTNGTSDTGNDNTPQLAAGGFGRWVAVWESEENLGGVASEDTDIFASAFTLAPEAPEAAHITPNTAGPTNASTVEFTVEFTEAVVNFDEAGDLRIVHMGTAHDSVSLSGGRQRYTVSIGGISGDGTFRLAVSTDSDVEDTAGNGLASSVTSLPIVIDTTGPPVRIGTPSVPITNGGPVSYTITYMETETVDLAPASVTVNATGTAEATVTVSGSGPAMRTVTLSDISGNGELGISVSAGTAVDEAGNSAESAGPSETVTVDNTAPSVMVTTPSAEPTRAARFAVDAVFSEPVTGFDQDDVLVEHAAISNFVGDEEAYSFEIVANPPGVISVQVEAGGATDAAGNGNSASNVLSRTVALEGPVLRVFPGDASFGPVEVATSAERTVIVENVGTGTVVGEATTRAPFHVVGGNTYDLAAGERQAVQVEFRPEEVGSFFEFVEFTGGGGGMASLNGDGVAGLGRIRGSVTAASDGAAVGCAAVAATSNGGSIVVALTSRFGDYELASLPIGTYTIEVSAPGFANATADAAAETGSTTVVDFPLAPSAGGGTISGRVTDKSTGEALGGVRVDALVDGEPVGTSYTCDEGRYTVANLNLDDEAMVSLRFSAELYGTVEEVVTIETGKANEQNVALTPDFSGIDVAGVITDSNTGEPLADVDIRMEVHSANVSMQVATDQAGAYHFGNGPAGELVDFRITAMAYPPQLETRQLDGADMSRVDFALNGESTAGCFGAGAGRRPTSFGDLGTVVLLALVAGALWRRPRQVHQCKMENT